MKIVILDFSDGKVKIVNNVAEDLQIEELEDLLVNKYNFKLSEIEFMLVPELEIETL